MFTIRCATELDVETIGQLANLIWHGAYAEILTPEQIEYMLNWMYSPQTINKELKEGINWELIQDNSTPIGFISTTVEDTTVKLNKLYIKAAYHGKGIGQIALEHIKSLSRKKGLQSIYLTVNKANHKAMKAYEKAGFIRTDSKVFDIGGGFVMDDYIYTFSL